MDHTKQKITVLYVIIAVLALALTASVAWALSERDRADEISQQHIDAGHSSGDMR